MAAAAAAEMEKMSVEQVKAVKEQADMEVNILQDSLNNIRTATSRLEVASSALEDLSLRPKGKKLLVPLTASLYVPGTLDDADKVLVDVGTGYFIEKTTAEGKDYCDRKINLLRSNFDQLVEYYRLGSTDWEGATPESNAGCGNQHRCPCVGVTSEGSSQPHFKPDRYFPIVGWTIMCRQGFSANKVTTVAAKKKSIADEAAVILQAKLKHLAPST
ncbi:putative prefoldin subunit 5 [Quercus suber]|uniref:Prefoldin subunit 5 n=1 Tax=Quercus suber TaxID=58331 RepID=A0AAW0JYG2_QUESU